jgi:hypothetical protein
MSMETKRPGGVPPSALIDPSEGYEHRDADTRSLLKYGIGLVLVLAVVLLSMKWMFSYFAKSQPLGPPASPFDNARVLPPEPRLQAKPRADLRNYCGEQMEKLDTYAWVDHGYGRDGRARFASAPSKWRSIEHCYHRRHREDAIIAEWPMRLLDRRR